MMTTIMKDFIFEDNEELRKVFTESMEGQFGHDFYDKSFNNQLESDETDALQQRIEWWMVVVDRGVQYPTKFMNIVLPNCLICIVKLKILKCKDC